jgi:hypothetical protein
MPSREHAMVQTINSGLLRNGTLVLQKLTTVCRHLTVYGQSLPRSECCGGFQRTPDPTTVRGNDSVVTPFVTGAILTIADVPHSGQTAKFQRDLLHSIHSKCRLIPLVRAVH